MRGTVYTFLFQLPFSPSPQLPATIRLDRKRRAGLTSNILCKPRSMNLTLKSSTTLTNVGTVLSLRSSTDYIIERAHVHSYRLKIFSLSTTSSKNVPPCFGRTFFEFAWWHVSKIVKSHASSHGFDAKPLNIDK